MITVVNAKQDLSGPIMDSTADMLGLADVHRWVVVKTNRQQNVAEHCYNVQVLAIEICTRLGLDEAMQYQCMKWAMIHDVPETLTGDIDGKFKRLYPDLRRKLVEAENASFPWYASEAESIPTLALAIVKLADKLETVLFLMWWGVGPRAGAVLDELQTTILVGAAQGLSNTGVASEDQVYLMATDILEFAAGERGTIQFREPGV